MATEEEALRQLAVELQLLEGTAQTLQSRINMVTAALTELRIANATLDGLKKETEGASLLVPIGGGSYIQAKLENVDKMIVGLGAGVAVEKTLDEAKTNVEKRGVELEKTRLALQQQLTQIVEKMEEGRSQFQSLTEKMNQKEIR